MNINTSTATRMQQTHIFYFVYCILLSHFSSSMGTQGDFIPQHPYAIRPKESTTLKLRGDTNLMGRTGDTHLMKETVR